MNCEGRCDAWVMVRGGGVSRLERMRCFCMCVDCQAVASM